MFVAAITWPPLLSSFFCLTGEGRPSGREIRNERTARAGCGGGGGLTDLDGGDAEAAGLEQDADAAGRHALPEPAHHSAGHQHVLHDGFGVDLLTSEVTPCALSSHAIESRRERGRVGAAVPAAARRRRWEARWEWERGVFFIFFVGLGDSKGRLGFGSAEGRALNRALALASERERTRATGGAHYRAPSRAL